MELPLKKIPISISIKESLKVNVRSIFFYLCICIYKYTEITCFKTRKVSLEILLDHLLCSNATISLKDLSLFGII